MVTSNGDVVRAAVAAFNGNDMEGVAACCTEDCVSIPFEGWPDAPVYRGREGMKRLAGAWWEAFSGTRIQIERLIEDGDRVVMLSKHTATAEGLEVAQPLGGVFDLRDGLLHRLHFFVGHEETLAAAGLDQTRSL